MKNVILSDTALVIGFVSLCYGIWLAWRPACFMAGGIMLILFGLLMERGRAVKGAKRES